MPFKRVGDGSRTLRFVLDYIFPILTCSNTAYRAVKSHDRQLCYTSIQCMIILMKDRTSYGIAKRVAPSLSLLKGPSLNIRNRTTLTQGIGKLFTSVLSLSA